jgi:hypothetical protein
MMPTATPPPSGKPGATPVNTITGSLGSVTVTDLRGGTLSWGVAAASTTFTGTNLSVSDAVDYTAPQPGTTGTSTISTTAKVSDISTAKPVVAATATSGGNTATWNPTLDVNMPAGALAGAYAGTVTTSVA